MSKVAVLKTSPASVINDYSKLMDLAEYKKFVKKENETILKLNLSWSLYYPACSTEPWQLDGVLKKLKNDRYENLHAVENETVVTNVMHGAKQNKWLDVLKRYNLKFEPLTKVEWIKFKPKKELLVLDEIFSNGLQIPKMFIGKNVVHFPTMKCVHPNTEIFLADGSLVKIKDFVDEIHLKNEIRTNEEGDLVASSIQAIPSLDKNGKIVIGNAVQFWKTPVQGMLFTIKTRTGREVIVSDKHPFLTSEGWKCAKDLHIGERIAVPRKISILGQKQCLPKLPSVNSVGLDINTIYFTEGYKISANVQKKIIFDYFYGKQVKKIVECYKISNSAFKYLLKKYKIPPRLQRNWQVVVPQYTSPDFWRWIGYFFAEGYLGKDNSFTFVNSSKDIQNDYISLTKKLFHIDVDVKRVKELRFTSVQLAEFFKELGFHSPLHAGNKFVPRLLFRCTEEEIANFLLGLFEGDIGLAKRQNKRGFDLVLVLKSEQLIYEVQLLLLRLGVISFRNIHFGKSQNWVEKKKYYKLTIYRPELVSLLKFISLKKYGSFLLKDCELIRRDSNWETVPFSGKSFRELREILGLTRKEVYTKFQSLAAYEYGYRGVTPWQLKKYIEKLREIDVKGCLTEKLNYVDFLLSESIVWDYVVDVEIKSSDVDYLYDLSVLETNNFIGNGIILHNTHGHTTLTCSLKNAFGGLITKKRHHCHKKIHEVLVDLLTIQKEIHTGLFAVTDGTVAGDGAGPRTMVPKIKNYILASGDQVAIDAISAKMMGFDPMRIKFIKLAHDRGLGCGDVNQIEVVGEDISRVNFHFRTSKSPVIFGDQMFRKGALSFVEPLLFHTGLFKVAVFGSAFYHDYLWYPTIGKHRVNKFMKTTWGELWKRY